MQRWYHERRWLSAAAAERSVLIVNGVPVGRQGGQTAGTAPPQKGSQVDTPIGGSSNRQLANPTEQPNTAEKYRPAATCSVIGTTCARRRRHHPMGGGVDAPGAIRRTGLVDVRRHPNISFVLWKAVGHRTQGRGCGPLSASASSRWGWRYSSRRALDRHDSYDPGYALVAFVIAMAPTIVATGLLLALGRGGRARRPTRLTIACLVALAVAVPAALPGRSCSASADLGQRCGALRERVPALVVPPRAHSRGSTTRPPPAASPLSSSSRPAPTPAIAAAPSAVVSAPARPRPGCRARRPGAAQVAFAVSPPSTRSAVGRPAAPASPRRCRGRGSRARRAPPAPGAPASCPT